MDTSEQINEIAGALAKAQSAMGHAVKDRTNPHMRNKYATLAAVIDAARAMGMTERQVPLRAEVPNALPLILGGLRTATLQIVATATVAAMFGLNYRAPTTLDEFERDYATALKTGATLIEIKVPSNEVAEDLKALGSVIRGS